MIDHKTILSAYLNRMSKTDLAVIADRSNIGPMIGYAIAQMSPEDIKDIEAVIENEAFYMACEELN